MKDVSTAGGLLTQRMTMETLPAGRRWLVIDALRQNGDEETKEEDAVIAGAPAGAAAIATALGKQRRRRRRMARDVRC